MNDKAKWLVIAVKDGESALFGMTIIDNASTQNGLLNKFKAVTPIVSWCVVEHGHDEHIGSLCKVVDADYGYIDAFRQYLVIDNGELFLDTAKVYDEGEAYEVLYEYFLEHTVLEREIRRVRGLIHEWEMRLYGKEHNIATKSLIGLRTKLMTLIMKVKGKNHA